MDYKGILLEIFPNRLEQHIDNIIDIVTENTPEEEYKLEEMINLLTESGDSTFENQDEAAGYGHGFIPGNGYIFNVLKNLFPNTDSYSLEKYYQEKCKDKSTDDLNLIIDELLDEYVIECSRSDSIFEQLYDMMPDADPDYLRKEAETLSKKTDQELESFIDHAIEKQDYPTKKDYLKRQKTINELKIYTTEFSVENFLEIFNDPFEHFSKSSYKPALICDNVSEEDENYALHCLMNFFPYLREKDIRKVFKQCNKNLMKTSDILGRIPRYLKAPRKEIIPIKECENLQLAQELAFIKHKQLLKTAIKMKNDLYRIVRAEAEKYNLLETCQCCFFEGLLPEECYFCKKNCPFCKECVAKGAETVIGRGEITFPCLSTCNSEFDLTTLRMVLNKKLFEPLLTKIQIDELKKANIHGLETCPFCDFSMIMTDNEKIFRCQNEECMEQTCRECRHKSHVPFKCNEIEYDEDVRKRTYIENKMTEALVRTCWKCNKSFLKESGCNKMTCSCGAKMCYVCGAANINYEHFGETKYNKCPLYTQDLNKFHADRVIRSAQIAKAELGVNNNPELLKIDPTLGLEEFFNQQRL